jgi:hypothetical protein
MTPADFRRLALSMPEATEAYRRGHSQFRVERKAFASLEGPADSVATIYLTSDQQELFVHSAPETFAPVLGGWGRLGSTSVRLASADENAVKSALEAAWRNVARRSLLKRIDKPPS